MFKLFLLSIFLQSIDCKNNFVGTFFTVFSSDLVQGQLWHENQNLTSLNCSKDENLSFIVHGFRSSKGEWQLRLKDQFVKYRGGCVIIFNWGTLSDHMNYYKVVKRNWPIAVAVLLSRLRDVTSQGFLEDNILLYGHSLGARMVVETGLQFGEGKISQIDGSIFHPHEVSIKILNFLQFFSL